jgi:uncharacterized RDD family membrane protein YckC
MNPSDVQSDTEPTYFDPEEIDMSEQQFAASLEISAEKPQFEIDEMEVAREETRPVSVAEPVAESLTVEAPGAQAEPVRQIGADRELHDAAAAGVDSVHLAPERQPDWRNLVSAKVNSYKARKPQKDRYPSLKLQFDPPVQRAVREREAAATFESVQERVPEPPVAVHSAPILPPESHLEPPRIVLEATARVIEFPRPAFPRGDELADPIMDRPRIMEAPERLPPPPAMGGILMAPPQEPEPERRPGFDVPLQSAPMRQRIAAGVFDAVLVAIAMALFEYIFLRINGSMPPLRSAATLAAGLLAVLWPAYQYSFLVFCGRTPGLRVAKLRISRFDGEPVSRSLRRWRVLASVLSLASLGLGYAWCFLDEDQLSWHDRITRTHLAP